MEHRFAGAQATIVRARERLAELEQQISSARGSVYGLELDAVVEGAELVVRGRLPTEPLTEWALTAGESVHHLRSALEYLIYELRGGTGERTNSGFPCADTPESFRRQLPMIDGIGDDLISLVRGRQPYRQDNPHAHPLWLLHELWNREKHRLPYVTYADLRGYTALFRAKYGSIRTIVRDLRVESLLGVWGEVARWTPPDDVTDPMPFHQSVLSTGVVFAEDDLVDRAGVVPLLQDLAAWVEETVYLFTQVPGPTSPGTGAT